MSNARASAFVLIILLLTFGVYRTQTQLRPDRTIDSYGTNGAAYGAAYELLGALGTEVRRNVRPPTSLDGGPDGTPSTIWWLNGSHQVCLGETDESWAPQSWVDAGGTAIVFLQPGNPSCDVVGRFMLPPLSLPPEPPETDCPIGEDGEIERAGADERALANERGDEPGDRTETAASADGGLAVDHEIDAPVASGPKGAPEDVDPERSEPCNDDDSVLADLRATIAKPIASSDPEWIDGPVARAPRDLSIAGLARFDEPSDDGPWQVVARLDGDPFVLEARSGAGRIVVVADDRFVTNRYLDFNDASLLVVDLAATYGPPVFDEFSHGYRPEGGVLPYLATSPAWPVFASIVLIGALVLWRGSAIPRRVVDEADPRAPALEPFVESLSNLYAACADQAGILGHYREQIVDRARRRHHLPVGTSRRDVLEHASTADLPVSYLERALEAPPPARGRRSFERETERLDQLLEKMTQ